MTVDEVLSSHWSDEDVDVDLEAPVIQDAAYRPNNVAARFACSDVPSRIRRRSRFM